MLDNCLGSEVLKFGRSFLRIFKTSLPFLARGLSLPRVIVGLIMLCLLALAFDILHKLCESRST